MKKDETFLSGIDISHHNFSRELLRFLAQIGRTNAFVIMKATEGVSYIDPAMTEYLSALYSLTDNPLIGFYHYVRPDRKNNAADEAYYFLNTIQNYLTKAVICMDVEGLSLSAPDLDNWCAAWALAVEAYSGVCPMIYCSRAEVGRFKKVHEHGCGLWCADWSAAAAPDVPLWGKPAIWQYSAKTIDCDIFFGGREGWLRYANPNTDR